MPRGASIGALAWLALCSLAPARVAEAQAHPTSPPLAIAVRRTGPITIDGRLDEPDWQRAAPATDFRQAQPDEGQPATQRAEVRFLYDDDAIYIGARMYDTEGAAGIRTRLVRRDAPFGSDYVEIIFDTFHDHLGRVDFAVNPSGSIQDSYGPNGSDLDLSWDAVWQVRTRIDSLGWTAEFRIPLSQLRYPATDSAETWGLQIWRQENRLNELSQWAFWHLNETGGPAKFGHLEGLALRRAPGGGELLPYMVGRSTNDPSVAPGDPFARSRAYDTRVGGDFKYLVSSSLTLNGTVNPDFGQVEVDPAVVNLSAFETFFQEKRPFFVEGKGLFDFGNFNCFACSNVNSVALFYPRRIGRAPQGAGNAYAAAASGYADVPGNTTILGAAKLTGLVASGWTLAALDAGTARERAQIQDSTGRRFAMEVEPFTNYFVGRISHDLPGGSYIRAMATSVVRDIRDTTLRTQLNTHSEAGGVETDLWWGKRTYRLMANATMTQVTGSAADILALQESSRRYFQRPDRANGTNGLFSNRFDSTLTSLRGYSFYTRFAKDAGEWLWEVQASATSPGFEANDVAFNTQSDRFWVNANLARQITRPNRFARQQFYILGAQQITNYGGDLLNREVHGYAQFLFNNYWQLSFYGQIRPRLMSDNLARGGSVLGQASSWYSFAQLNTDSRKRVVLTAMPDLGCADGHCTWNLSVDATIHAAPNVAVDVNPAYSYITTANQYVTTVADPTATLFYGHRYVFADLVEKTLSMSTRVDWTFTPQLTLQLFVQPLIASGAYTRFKEFRRPRSLDRAVYGVDTGTISYASGAYTVDPDGAGPAAPFSFGNPDFTFRSLRGSAVLRWEYSPGSTIYFVWTQTRSASDPFGTLVPSRDVKGLLGPAPENIFLVKFSYWIGL